MSLQVFDVNGRLVATLAEGEFGAGVHSFDWAGRDASGAAVKSGMYFYRLIAPGFTQTRKMLLLH